MDKVIRLLQLSQLRQARISYRHMTYAQRDLHIVIAIAIGLIASNIREVKLVLLGLGILLFVGLAYRHLWRQKLIWEGLYTRRLMLLTEEDAKRALEMMLDAQGARANTRKPSAQEIHDAAILHGQPESEMADER